MSNTNYKIVYTLRLHVELQQRGFECKTEMKNPRFPAYNCWVYEATPEFLDVFNELTKRGAHND